MGYIFAGLGGLVVLGFAAREAIISSDRRPKLRVDEDGITDFRRAPSVVCEWDDYTGYKGAVTEHRGGNNAVVKITVKLTLTLPDGEVDRVELETHGLDATPDEIVRFITSVWRAVKARDADPGEPDPVTDDACERLEQFGERTEKKVYRNSKRSLVFNAAVVSVPALVGTAIAVLAGANPYAWAAVGLIAVLTVFVWVRLVRDAYDPRPQAVLDARGFRRLHIDPVFKLVWADLEELSVENTGADAKLHFLVCTRDGAEESFALPADGLDATPQQIAEDISAVWQEFNEARGDPPKKKSRKNDKSTGRRRAKDEHDDLPPTARRW